MVFFYNTYRNWGISNNSHVTAGTLEKLDPGRPLDSGLDAGLWTQSGRSSGTI